MVRMAILDNHFHFGPVYFWKPLTSRIKPIPCKVFEVLYELILAYCSNFPIYTGHWQRYSTPSRICSFTPLCIYRYSFLFLICPLHSSFPTPPLLPMFSVMPSLKKVIINLSWVLPTYTFYIVPSQQMLHYTATVFQCLLHDLRKMLSLHPYVLILRNA